MAGTFEYIICAARQRGRFADTRRPVAHMAWQMGEGLRLLPVLGETDPHGGYMVLCDAAGDDGGAGGGAGDLAAECLAVCQRRGFLGLVCDFEKPVRRAVEGFVRAAAELFFSKGLCVFVPERYGEVHPGLRVMVSTALAQGSLRRRLQEAAERYGPARIALEMERLCRDIRLPSERGLGKAMDDGALDELLKARGGVSFFSGELCARYFTERDGEGHTHFYLYDDAYTFGRKAELAQSLGITQGFILHPDAKKLGI